MKPVDLFYDLDLINRFLFRFLFLFLILALRKQFMVTDSDFIGTLTSEGVLK